MSSIIFPSRGKCIQITDSQRCQCQWFFPPESPLLDQLVCGLCEHGIHAHADYFSTVVNCYPSNQCAAYAQTTHLGQRCTCEAQFYEHIATDNWYQLAEPSTVLDYFNPDPTGLQSPNATMSNDANNPFFPNTTSSSSYSTSMSYGNATSTPFTLTYMPSTSPYIDPYYPYYDDAVIFTPIPQPVAQIAMPQIEAHPRLEVENSYSVQYQDHSFRVNVQDSRPRSYQDDPFRPAHGTEAWAGQL
ncbi:hypothetical protein IW261DRAFT_1461708, partial [Armillaria novae-zelandiae]